MPKMTVKGCVLTTVIFMMSLGNLPSQNAKNKPQPEPGDPHYAEELFKGGNFFRALDEYVILYGADSNNMTYARRLAVCYLNTNKEKENALALLLKVKNAIKPDAQLWYDLGRAYQYTFHFTDAIEAFTNYMSLKPKRDNNPITASRQIEMCRNAIALTAQPVEVSFENAGQLINSAFPDYNPYVSADESTLAYTSKRPGNLGGLADFDGYPTSDIFITEREGIGWKKPKRPGSPLNTNFIDECTWLSPDGNKMMIFQLGTMVANDILLSVRKGKSFQGALSPGKTISLPKSIESAGCISGDGLMLFFASDRPGGFGKSDIYYCRKEGNTWGEAVNAGPEINTAWDEDFPYLMPGDDVLFFSSQGHNSMGGFDIFFSRRNRENNTFEAAVNLGYPINTPENNLSISFAAQPGIAWISARRNDGYGDLDIYRITIHQINTILNGIKTR